VALAFRIDGYTQHPDGRVEVRYTAGKDPLPAAWSGQAWVFFAKADLTEFLSEGTAEWLTPELALRFVAAIWKQAQPAMSNPNVVVGKTLIFDPASLTATMQVV